MQVVKALYRSGDIQLLAPLTGIEEAELLVIVLDRDGETSLPARTFRRLPDDSEQNFKALGMAHFFDTDDDNEVEWAEVFDVPPR